MNESHTCLERLECEEILTDAFLFWVNCPWKLHRTVIFFS